MSELVGSAYYDSQIKYTPSIKNELERLSRLVLEMYKWESVMAKKLIHRPSGFEFAGEGRQCVLCLGADSRMWYDELGIKCLDCEDALNKKIIPKYTISGSKGGAYVTGTFLISNMGYSKKEIRSKVLKGELKARVIEHASRDNTYIFLKKENSDLFLNFPV